MAQSSHSLQTVYWRSKSLCRLSTVVLLRAHPAPAPVRCGRQLGDFNWNLGTDDAAEVSSNTLQSNPVVPRSALPSTALSSTALPSPVVPNTVQPGAAPQAMSRRELRNRRAAESAAEPATAQLAELFQFAETAVEAAPPAHSPGSVQSVSAPLEAGSRRAAKSVGAHTIGATASTTMPAAETGEAKAHTQSKRAQSKHPKSARPTASARPPRTQSPRKTAGRRTFFSKLFSIGTMVGIAAIMVSTSLPANAFFNPTAAAPTKASSAQSQSQSMEVASTVTEPVVSRDAYTVSSLLEQLRLKYGNRNFSYTNDINGTIQWPFPVPVPISSGFGPRIAPCGGCSSVHEGVDFTPGRGVAIGSIADGVVSAVIASHAGLGNHVIVDHVINGQLVQSVYGHMLDNSFTVTVGEAVKVTQKLGEVGSTGESTGAHLHLEIHINKVPVDPFAWLKANAN